MYLLNIPLILLLIFVGHFLKGSIAEINTKMLVEAYLFTFNKQFTRRNTRE